MRVLLDGPRHFDNLCAVVRTLEVLGFRECFVHDTAHLVQPRYGKRRRREAQTISAGAFERVSLARVEDPAAWLAASPGRVIATALGPSAVPLPGFAFQSDDTIVFGGEAHGVRPALLEQAHVRITIPQRGHTQSLNLSVAVGVVLYAACFGT